MTPAWCWHKKHWSGVYYEQIDKVIIKEWIRDSYQLVAAKLPKVVRQKYIVMLDSLILKVVG